MDAYKLIDRDQMEPSKLRRKLDPWNSAKSHRVKPLITEILSSYSHNDLKIAEPKWESNVYPLYYYYYEDRAKKKKESVFPRIFEEYQRLFPEVTPTLQRPELCKLITSVANAEIDILIEDNNYFVFVEVKSPGAGRRPKFTRDREKGIHQLVRQYVQGKFLERAVGKKFMIATIGACGLSPLGLNQVERLLLEGIGEEREDLEIYDFPWSILDSP